MYLRAVHAEHDIPILQNFVKETALGILTTAIPSSNFPLLQSTHIPWVYDILSEEVGDDSDGSERPLGTLRGHMARNNPHAKALLEAVQGRSGPTTLESEVMIMFTSVYNGYVTPQFYTETKPSTGKVVPTWDYAAVQAYGTATLYFDHNDGGLTSNFLLDQINRLTDIQELNSAESRRTDTSESADIPRWKVADAPTRYVELLSKAIVGISIEVTRLEGKFKMSQEMGIRDRKGVINGFRNLHSETGDALADLVEQRGRLQDQR